MKDIVARPVADALSFPVQEQIVPVVFPFSAFGAAGVTFTHAAQANKIKIVGSDKTADYIAGRVVTFTQDAATKYFTVGSSVLSGSDTIVTLVPFGSEVVTVSAITVPKVGQYIRMPTCAYGGAVDKILAVGVDVTASYTAGKIIKITQGTTEKLFVVVSSALIDNVSPILDDTEITVTALSGDDVADEAVIDPMYCVPAAAGVTYVYTAVINEIVIAGSDETTTFAAGVLVRFTQDTVVKNFTVVSSSFSTDTTVVLTPVAGAVVTSTAITTPLIANTTGTTASDIAKCNGTIGSIVFSVPVLASTNTATLNIKNSAGAVLYTTGAKAHSTDYPYDPTDFGTLMLANDITFEVVLSAAQATPVTVTVTLYSR